MLNWLFIVVFLPLVVSAKTSSDTVELTTLMETYANQVARGNFSVLHGTEDFKVMFDIDKARFAACTKKVCKVKFVKAPNHFSMGNQKAVKLFVDVYSDNQLVSEPKSCYILINEKKKWLLDSFVSNCE